jgi:hypothetical protein
VYFLGVQAAETGHIPAMTFLFQLLRTGFTEANGFGKDEKQTFHWL